jgi:DNA gyrase/topoisomerase IV subunit A
MLITIQGKILRMASKDIRTIGRSTQGVRLIDIEGEDRAVSIARLAERDDVDKDLDAGDDTAATGAATATVEGQEQAIAELLKRADAAEDADEGAGTEGETAAGNEDDDKDGAE